MFVLCSHHRLVKHLEHSETVELNGYGWFPCIAADIRRFLITWTGIQWWIQDFPDGGRQPKSAILIFWPISPEKKPKKLDQAVARVWCPSHLRSANSVDSFVLHWFITTRKRSLGQGNMFTGVCLSTGGCLVPGRGGPWSRGVWSWGGTWSGGGCLVWGGLIPGGASWRDPPNGHCCGRYASYWNAFLFFSFFFTWNKHAIDLRHVHAAESLLRMFYI